MRIGILEIMALPSSSVPDGIINALFVKQYAGVTPQAISVWCRQLGHDTFYATYYGFGDVSQLLPKDLDFIFISCCTLASPLAYAIGKLYRQTGTTTVIGGPHAESFPADCLRFFDLVVKDCDRNLITDIIAGHFDPGQYISSAKPFDDCPTVEEREPEIRAATLFQSKWPGLVTTVPMITSMGCPYTCDFCTDWDSTYRVLPTERLATDIEYLAKHYPNAVMLFVEPNFAIQFDRIFKVLEAVPPESRMTYGMECSLSILDESRAKRLQDTNCLFSIHGVESWQDYSLKAGSKHKTGLEKVNKVVAQLQQLHDYVPYLQAGFVFGVDTDMGEEPIELTKQFMEKTPFVWPVINIPTPYGGTPMFDRYLANDRILQTMPFAFYQFPYLVTTLKHYNPAAYFEHLIDLSKFASSRQMLEARLKSTSNCRLKLAHIARTISEKQFIKRYSEILNLLCSDSQFRSFHERESNRLPEFYQRRYDEMVGPYARLLSLSERTPCLDQITPQIA